MGEVDNKILKHCKECSEDRKRERHDLIYPKIQEITSSLDDKVDDFKEESVKTHNELGNTLNLTIQAMKNLEKVVTDGFKNINTKLDKFEEKYATKEELNKTNDKVTKIDLIFEKLGVWAIRILGGSLISLIIYIFYDKVGK